MWLRLRLYIQPQKKIYTLLLISYFSKEKNHVVDLLVSGNAAQSRPEKPLSVNIDDDLKSRPFSRLPLGYFIT